MFILYFIFSVSPDDRDETVENDSPADEPQKFQSSNQPQVGVVACCTELAVMMMTPAAAFLAPPPPPLQSTPCLYAVQQHSWRGEASTHRRCRATRDWTRWRNACCAIAPAARHRREGGDGPPLPWVTANNHAGASTPAGEDNTAAAVLLELPPSPTSRSSFVSDVLSTSALLVGVVAVCAPSPAAAVASGQDHARRRGPVHVSICTAVSADVRKRTKL